MINKELTKKQGFTEFNTSLKLVFARKSTNCTKQANFSINKNFSISQVALAHLQQGMEVLI